MNKYSKMVTQFETQSMAFTKLRMALEYPKYIVRGYDGYISIYLGKEDTRNPEEIMRINVRPSLTAAEVGFFPKGRGEYLLVGRDAAWNVAEDVLKVLRAVHPTASQG